MEEWKDIKGYDGAYKISNLGRVKSFKNYNNGRILRQHPHDAKSKYQLMQVSLYKYNKVKSMKIHRLVALYFVSNPLNKLVVNHIDNNSLNNVYTNLEWVTTKENVHHAMIYGNMGNDIDVEKLEKDYKIMGFVKLGKKYDISPCGARNILKKNGVKLRTRSQAQNLANKIGEYYG